MEKEIENLIEQLTKVRPEMLNEEALKLFNTIMAVLDERDKLREDLKKSIPKSKVLLIMRDIQERTEKLINTTYVPLSSRIYNDNKERYEPMLVGRTIAMGALQSLQELMEDK